MYFFCAVQDVLQERAGKSSRLACKGLWAVCALANGVAQKEWISRSKQLVLRAQHQQHIWVGIFPCIMSNQVPRLKHPCCVCGLELSNGQSYVPTRTWSIASGQLQWHMGFSCLLKQCSSCALKLLSEFNQCSVKWDWQVDLFQNCTASLNLITSVERNCQFNLPKAGIAETGGNRSDHWNFVRAGLSLVQ